VGYKDKGKQKEAIREATKRYRERKRGITVIPEKVIPEEVVIPSPVIPDVIPKPVIKTKADAEQVVRTWEEVKSRSAVGRGRGHAGVTVAHDVTCRCGMCRG